MFRDLKEYHEIAKIYADKVSKPENLEERRGASPEQLAANRKDAFKGVPNSASNKRAEMSKARRGDKKFEFKKPTGGAQGRTRRPEIKKPLPTTAEIRAKNPKVVPGTRVNEIGAKGGGKPSSGDLSMFKDKKPEAKPKPKLVKFKGKMVRSDNQKYLQRQDQLARTKAMFDKRKAEGKTIQQVKDENKASMRAKAAERNAAFKAKRAEKKAAMEEYTPYDLVLDYLLSSEQAATIEEANYVMTEMDVETIQAIVEEQKKNIDEGIGKALMIGGALATPFLMKKFMKPKTDKMLDTQRKTSPIGGENRKKKIEKAAGAEGFFN